MSEQLWYRQGTRELHEAWFAFLSPGARCAWIYLKAYVKECRYSQKRADRAESMDVRVAARQWGLEPAHVEELILAAVEAKVLTVEGTDWVLADVSPFVSERSAPLCRKTPQNVEECGKTQNNDAKSEDSSTLCGKTTQNAEERGKVCHETETETGTETDIDPSVPEGGVGETPTPQRRSWLQVHEEVESVWPAGRDPAIVFRWFEFRRNSKHTIPKTESIVTWCRQMSLHSDEALSWAIEQAIANGWRSIHPSKHPQEGKSSMATGAIELLEKSHAA